ncbi:hopanoid biosynthesis-associated protein HpnK [Sphingomonas immobilis]|uniref:Hopanoid biosynthesis-associated protein HpnK n=1 Tax=Sphingomonas immobilis TaxID=3063997 RepID=A0ABT8ZZP7_9SPHN|nr:hopanoid biosynthesis-associated protein HpnK [Sphingomonas sp. CA1-15]MDO7843058.1 hopanoid biosynthesis-associated protein HpnK [Sphingomonas sp. CA1-15]
MRTVIINADDFGVAVAVNEAVERAHREGILTTTSLMVTGAAVPDAVARAKAMPRLGVGLHVALAEVPPALPPAQIPDLVDANGHFRVDALSVSLALVARAPVRRQLEAEIEAQFALFEATGLPLDHVDSHKHMHMHPVIAATILRVGRRHGMRAVRAPVEPRAVLRKIEPVKGFDIAAPFARGFQRKARRAGFKVPDHVFGLAWSGAMRTERLRAILQHLPEGVSEVYLHPATGPYPLSAPGYAYADELAALTDPVAREIVSREGITLARFADL